MIFGNRKRKNFLAEIKLKRKEWRNIRKKRLFLKDQLLSSCITIQEIRKNKNYRKLGKEQHRLGIRLKHLLKKI